MRNYHTYRRTQGLPLTSNVWGDRVSPVSLHRLRKVFTRTAWRLRGPGSQLAGVSTASGDSALRNLHLPSTFPTSHVLEGTILDDLVHPSSTNVDERHWVASIPRALDGHKPWPLGPCCIPGRARPSPPQPNANIGWYYIYMCVEDKDILTLTSILTSIVQYLNMDQGHMIFMLETFSPQLQPNFNVLILEYNIGWGYRHPHPDFNP